MANEAMETRLEALMRRVLDLGATPTADAMRRGAVPEWDSLRHVKLMLEIQKEFGARFPATEIIGLDSYGAILQALRLQQNGP